MYVCVHASHNQKFVVCVDGIVCRHQTRIIGHEHMVINMKFNMVMKNCDHPSSRGTSHFYKTVGNSVFIIAPSGHIVLSSLQFITS